MSELHYTSRGARLVQAVTADVLKRNPDAGPIVESIHEPEHRGPIWDVCRCGATRRAAQDGQPAGPWHSCVMCYRKGTHE